MRTREQHVAVIDIGKSNAKVALVDLDQLEEVAIRKRPNTVLAGPPYPHYDTDGLWEFVLASLAELQEIFGINAVVVTTHGASAALLDGDGKLAAPVLDYEYPAPDGLAHEYDAVRPAFLETGSPRLPMGLNLGAQLFWQFARFPDVRKRVRTIVTYPQYWVFRLTGKASNEVTSLGCHTDLWRPYENCFSSLVESQGWLPLMVPVVKAGDLVGPVTWEVAACTGLPPETPVFCGIHDSNASLYAHLVKRKAPFAVVSTGTWVISMVVGGRSLVLDPSRDTLVNVNALGDPVATSRFMGGREFDRLMGGRPLDFTQDDVASVLGSRIMLMPSVEPRSGPFPNRTCSWSTNEAQLSDGQRYVAVSFYLALMTATGLEITGADGEILVEGPFATNRPYLEMLASACGRSVRGVAGTGTSIGAALLSSNQGVLLKQNEQASTHTSEPPMEAYADAWRARVAST